MRQQAQGPAPRLPAAQAAPSCFLARIRRQEPDALDDATLLLNLIYMVQVARGDMTGLLLWVLKKLGDHPDYVRQLQAQLAPARDGQTAPVPELAGLIVKETLRLEQSEFLYRKALRQIDFNGVPIPSGWLIRICVREGHRDPALFADPERFDPYRFVGRSYGATEYSPLGLLGHSCLGAQIVNQIGRTFVTELARGFDLKVVADGTRELGTAHWTPSPAFRISLQPRAEAAGELVA